MIYKIVNVNVCPYSYKIVNVNVCPQNAFASRHGDPEMGTVGGNGTLLGQSSADLRPLGKVKI